MQNKLAKVLSFEQFQFSSCRTSLPCRLEITRVLSSLDPPPFVSLPRWRTLLTNMHDGSGWWSFLTPETLPHPYRSVGHEAQPLVPLKHLQKKAWHPQTGFIFCHWLGKMFVCLVLVFPNGVCWTVKEALSMFFNNSGKLLKHCGSFCQ